MFFLPKELQNIIYDYVLQLEYCEKYKICIDQLIKLKKNYEYFLLTPKPDWLEYYRDPFNSYTTMLIIRKNETYMTDIKDYSYKTVIRNFYGFN